MSKSLRIPSVPLRVIDGKVVRHSTGLMVSYQAEAPTNRLVLKLSMDGDSPKEFVSNSGEVCYLLSNSAKASFAYVNVPFFEENLQASIDPSTNCLVVEIESIASADTVLKNLLGGAK